MAVYRLWPSTSGPGAASADTANYTLGVEFSVSATANFTGWYFWCHTAATVTFSLYQVDSATTGTLVGQESSVSLVAPLGEWKYKAITLPVALISGQRYRATITSSTDNFYSATSFYWAGGGPGSSNITNGILTAYSASNATGNDQGSFIVGASPAFPTSEFNAGNYWIDPEVTDVISGTKSGSLSLARSHSLVINGARSSVGSLNLSRSRVFSLAGLRIPQGSVNLSRNHNLQISGSNVKSGFLMFNSSHALGITGQQPGLVLPPPPGITRSDIEYNYQQFTYVGELEPLTMLDYFKLNESDQSKLNRPPE